MRHRQLWTIVTVVMLLGLLWLYAVSHWLLAWRTGEGLALLVMLFVLIAHLDERLKWLEADRKAARLREQYHLERGWMREERTVYLEAQDGR